jgi:hypothetical protein
MQYGNGIIVLCICRKVKTECTDCLVLLRLFQRLDPLIGKETKILSILDYLHKIILYYHCQSAVL